jgi:LPXTG-site transpeptidase (sortase) family protein
LPVPDDWIDAVLAIEKSVDPSVVAARAGETAVFNLLVSTFDFPVEEVNVTDTLPEHWAYLAGSTTITLPDGSVVAGPGADPVVAGQQLSWDLMQDMAPGQSLSIVFSAQTTAGITGDVSRNDAQARGTRLGGEQVFTPIDSAWIYHAVLTIDKDTSTPEVTPGGTASYTIVLTNPSLVTITEVTVADDLPSGFTYAGGSVTAVNATRTGVTEPSLDEDALAWGTWDIEPNGSLTIAFDVNVDPAVPPGTYDNTASANSAQTGPIVDQGEIGDDAHAPPGQDPEEDEDVTIGDVLPTIEISKTADPTTVVEPGGMVTLRVRITNTSAEQVTLTSLMDDIHGDLDGQGTCGVPQIIAAEANYECAFEVEVLGSAGESQTDVVMASAVDDEGNPVSAEDHATVVVIGTGKALVGSNQPHTVSPSVAIGEILDYEASLVVPPGTLPNLTLTDVLDQGLAFVTCTEIVPSSMALSSTRGGFEVVCSTPTVGEEPEGSGAPADQGRRVIFDFGDLENAGEGAAVIAVRYQVVVLNNAENVDGVDLSNTARWQWEDGDLTSAAPEVGVVEPVLTLVKTASPGQAAPGTIITFALRIEHAVPSHSDAFDLVLTDTVPAGLTYIPGSLTWVQGHAPDLMEDAGAPTLRMEWDVLPNDGLRTVMRFRARLGNLAPGSGVTNSALLQWSSLPTEVRTPLSEHNLLSIERAYDPPSPVDVYVQVAETEVRRPLIPVTGFAPGKITRLPAPYGDSGLREMQSMWLEIPSLGVRVPITGVPLSDGGWDVTWLWDQAGYLEGTSFPTWQGNTALTAHATLPNGLPGPFAELAQLRWGDQVILEAFGQRYTYAVRQQRYVQPDDGSILAHEDYDWLTLITCAGYDETSELYRWRLAVRAVLVKIE